MALIVQDPSDPTESANSYFSLADWRIRAAELGITLPVDDTEAEGKILTGMLYVDSSNFLGEPVIAFQTTAWPRTGVKIYHGGELVEYDTDKIPQQVIDAVLYVSAETSVYKTTSGGQRVKSKKIDVIEKEFFDDGINAASFKRVARADALLSMFVARQSFNQFVYAV